MESVGNHPESLASFRLASFETHHRCPRTGRMLKYLTEILTGPRAEWTARPESRDPEWRVAAPAEIETLEPGEIAAIRWSGPVDESCGTPAEKSAESASLLPTMTEASV